MRIIDERGEQLGVITIDDALRRAEEAGLDLIEVAASADPPVCRIDDLAKFRFEQDKRARDARNNQRVSEVKDSKRAGASVFTGGLPCSLPQNKMARAGAKDGLASGGMRGPAARSCTLL